MFEMVGNLAKNSPGVSMPDFIRVRMELMGYRASYRQLSLLTGVPAMTLQRNFTGRRDTRLATALEVARVLNSTVEELAIHCNLI
jgi:hypothetical protein